MSACDGSGTVSRTSDAPAFQFDVMPKITTPPSTVTPMPASAARAKTSKTTATTTTTTTRTVKIENKWPAAEATAFSYQRATEQIGAEAKAIATARARETPTQKEKTGIINKIHHHCPNPCEELSINKLALRKAQLKAAFFGRKDNEKSTTCCNSTSYRTTYRTKYPRCKTEPGKPVQQLIEQFQAMIVQQQQQQLNEKEPKTLPGATASNSDEGCNVTGGGLSPYSSDNEDNTLSPRQRKLKVTRCASSDSALGLDVDDGGMDVVMVPPQRRMTLTVTDLPLRPALLPLAEPTALADSPLTSPTGNANSSVGVPTKVLLEERVVAAPGSRRESTQSSYSELGGLPLGVRYVRTPSVVVSDYSDDITACGISMEEMEYFRLQRARGQRRCSLEAGHGHGGGHGGHGHGGSGTAGMSPGCAKDEGQSDVSAASSCSNLYYCGSTISALDGGECIVNGVRVALARKSSTQSSSLSGEEEEEDNDDEDERDAEEDRDVEDLLQEDYERGVHERERERQISELLAATQLGDRQRDRSKKVGARNDVTNQGNLKLD
ncbi:uncharacterized protein LOC108103937 [Drosophila eugracilis]|uniref:uncharacterized protein LOC108103937 n=1 Tax=Drosophila eugracilis TaxID=29029 RepID=UPI0007E5E8FB|nr:uncharacterized protein LOC108103937 [Drosophila eugracilis]